MFEKNVEKLEEEETNLKLKIAAQKELITFFGTNLKERKGAEMGQGASLATKVLIELGVEERAEKGRDIRVLEAIAETKGELKNYFIKTFPKYKLLEE